MTMIWDLGDGDDVFGVIGARWPLVRDAVRRARRDVPDRRHALQDDEAALLYAVAREFANRPGARVVELGTLRGFSTSVIAQAAPQAAEVVTVDRFDHKVGRALARYLNVRAVQAVTWEYAAAIEDESLAMVFVDADHQDGVGRDTRAWWPKVAPGGVMLFHDHDRERFPRVVEAVATLPHKPVIAMSSMAHRAGFAGVVKA